MYGGEVVEDRPGAAATLQEVWTVEQGCQEGHVSDLPVLQRSQPGELPGKHCQVEIELRLLTKARIGHWLGLLELEPEAGRVGSKEPDDGREEVVPGVLGEDAGEQGVPGPVLHVLQHLLNKGAPPRPNIKGPDVLVVNIS